MSPAPRTAVDGLPGRFLGSPEDYSPAQGQARGTGARSLQAASASPGGPQGAASTQQPCVIWEPDGFADQSSAGWRGEDELFKAGLRPEDLGVSFLSYPE